MQNNIEKIKADFEYAPSIEATDIVNIQPKNQLFIGGKFGTDEREDFSNY